MSSRNTDSRRTRSRRNNYATPRREASRHDINVARDRERAIPLGLHHKDQPTPTFMESLPRSDRELLIRFASGPTKANGPLRADPSSTGRKIPLMQHGRSAVESAREALDQQEQMLFGKTATSARSSDPKESSSEKERPFSVPAYMKTIWELRHRLQTCSAENKGLQDRLALSDEMRVKTEHELKMVKKDKQEQVTRLAEQIERLISNEAEAVERMQQALAASESMSKALQASQTSEARLRNLLKTEMERSDLEKRDRPRAWQSLATQELLEKSEPPASFPTPRPLQFTQATFQSLTIDLKKSLVERDVLQSRVDQLQQKFDQQNVKQAKCNRESERRLAQMNAHLTGAVRRIQWLLQERSQLLAKLRDGRAYASKMETKLLRQHNLITLKKAKGSAKQQVRDRDEEEAAEEVTTAITVEKEMGYADLYDRGKAEKQEQEQEQDVELELEQEVAGSSRSSSHSPMRQFQKLSTLVERLMHSEATVG